MGPHPRNNPRSRARRRDEPTGGWLSGIFILPVGRPDQDIIKPISGPSEVQWGWRNLLFWESNRPGSSNANGGPS